MEVPHFRIYFQKITFINKNLTGDAHSRATTGSVKVVSETLCCLSWKRAL